MGPVPTGSPEALAAIARYAPRSCSGEVAAFARTLVGATSPQSPARAKALLFAAAKLSSFAVSAGLELRPEVVLSSAVIERYIERERGTLGGATARTIRSNLRAIARSALEHQPPGPTPLSRERAKAPYSEAQIDAYLALADAQPTTARRMHLAGLIALGAGAGLMGADLRGVAGRDVVARSGGLVVRVRGARPRVVPVLARLHDPLFAAARFAGADYVVGGYSARRRNVTSALVASVAGGAELDALDTSRLRATWLTSCARIIGLKGFMDAAGIVCTQRLGDLVASLEPLEEEAAVALLGGRP